MNTQRLKNYIIILFLILNAVLLFLNYRSNLRYTVSAEREATVKSLLAENEIYLYDPIYKDCSPKPVLKMTPVQFSQEDVAKMLLGREDLPSATKQASAGGIEYIDGSKTIYFQKSAVWYDNTMPDESSEFIYGDNDSMQRFCRGYIDKFGKISPKLDLYFDQIYTDGNVTEVEFRMKHKNFLIYSSYIRFTLTKEGLSQIYLQYYEVTSEGDKRDIYASDESLLALMYEIMNIYGKSPIIIHSVDLVYLNDAYTADMTEQITAMPYYRIYIQEQPEPFLVHACFNTVRK